MELYNPFNLGASWNPAVRTETIVRHFPALTSHLLASASSPGISEAAVVCVNLALEFREQERHGGMPCPHWPITLAHLIHIVCGDF